jgi:ribosomal protein S18 acetylase RimI-like enzyme
VIDATITRGVPGSIAIREGTANDLTILEPLFAALYDHQAAHGMALSLPSDAFAKWVAGMKPMLGRFTCLIVAETEAGLVGFVAGRVRPHPPYLGGVNAGYVSEVFVDDQARGQRVGARMLDAGIAWFAQRGIHRVELTVIEGNRDGLDFYRRLGWVAENRQLVWDSQART